MDEFKMGFKRMHFVILSFQVIYNFLWFLEKKTTKKIVCDEGQNQASTSGLKPTRMWLKL